MGGLLNTFWEAESGAISIDFPFLGNFPIAFGVKHVKRHPKLWCWWKTWARPSQCGDRFAKWVMSNFRSFAGKTGPQVVEVFLLWYAQVYIGTHPFIIYPEADFSCSFPHSLPLGPKVPFVTVICVETRGRGLCNLKVGVTWTLQIQKKCKSTKVLGVKHGKTTIFCGTSRESSETSPLSILPPDQAARPRKRPVWPGGVATFASKNGDFNYS